MSESRESRLAVVVLNDFCHVQGGASRVAIDEAVGIAQSGVDVTFVGAVGPISSDLERAPLRTINLGQSPLSTLRGNAAIAINGLWNRKSYAAVGEILDSLDRDETVVHVHGYTKSLSTSVIRCAVDRGFKTLCTLHDFFAACPTGGFFDFNTNRICKLRALSLACVTTNCDKRHYSHKLYRVARSLVQKHLGQFPTEVKEYIALSRKSAEVLRPYLPADARMHYLANPNNVARDTPVDVAANNTIVSIGRLDNEKGTSLVVDAARRNGMALTLIGDGPWRVYAEQYEHCRVTGWLTRDQIAAELRGARCLVFPSLWYETYGLVVEEAAACGVPSIVSDTCAAAERVQDGVTGWHFRAGDIDALAEYMNATRSDEVIRRLGENAFNEYWKDPPTTKVHTAQLIEIYRNLLTQ